MIVLLLLVYVGIGLIIIVIVYCRRDSVSFLERVPLPHPSSHRVFTRTNGVSCPVETCDFHTHAIPYGASKVDTNLPRCVTLFTLQSATRRRCSRLPCRTERISFYFLCNFTLNDLKSDSEQNRVIPRTLHVRARPP